MIKSFSDSDSDDDADIDKNDEDAIMESFVASAAPAAAVAARVTILRKASAVRCDVKRFSYPEPRVADSRSKVVLPPWSGVEEEEEEEEGKQKAFR